MKLYDDNNEDEYLRRVFHGDCVGVTLIMNQRNIIVPLATEFV